MERIFIYYIRNIQLFCPKVPFKFSFIHPATKNIVFEFLMLLFFVMLSQLGLMGLKEVKLHVYRLVVPVVPSFPVVSPFFWKYVVC